MFDWSESMLIVAVLLNKDANNKRKKEKYFREKAYHALPFGRTPAS